MGIFKKKSAIPMVFSTGSARPVIDNRENIELYSNWIYGCTQVRAEAVAKTEFKLYQVKANGEVERVIEHPLLDLLYRVNNTMTKYDFLELISTFRDIYGSAPIYLDFDGKKQPQNLYILDPRYLKTQFNQLGEIIKYEYRLGSFYKVLLPDEVIQLKNYNPQDLSKGFSPLDALLETAKQDDELLKACKNLLGNSSIPAGMLKIHGNPNEKEIMAIAEKFKEAYQGSSRWGSIPVLTDSIEYTPLSMKPADMQMTEQQSFNRDKILSIFRVPKELLGNTTTANRASAEAIEYSFNKNTITPIIQKMIEQLNEFLVPYFADNLYLDFEPLATADRQAEINEINVLVDRVITKNEAREILGYDAIDGGDTLDIGGSFIEMKSRVKREKAFEIKTKVLNRNKRKNEVKKITENIVKEITASGKKIKVLKGTNSKGKINAENRKKFQQETLKSEEEQEVKFTREIKRYFAKQYDTLKNAVELDFKSFKAIDGVDRQKEAVAMMSIIEPIYFESAMRAVEGAEKYFAPKQYVKPEYTNLKLWISRTAKKWAEEITDTTIKELEEIILNGKEEGQSIQEVMNALQKIYTDMTDNRAQMIARTETARAYDEAHYQAYTEMGYERIEWLLAPDCCEDCEDLSRKEWTIDTIRGQQPVHPNCRCDFAPLI